MRPGHQDLLKGGGNGIFLLILSLKWWMDHTDEMEAGELKEWSNQRLKCALHELDQSLSAIHASGALNGMLAGCDEEAASEEDSDVELEHGKR